MSDGTTTTGGRCDGCGDYGALCCFDCMRQEDDGIRAENARLRERVALLEGAGNAMSELVVRWMESATFSDLTDWYECRDCEAEGPAPEIIRHADGCAIGRWLAALHWAEVGDVFEGGADA